MEQAVLARKELDEGAERLDADDTAGVLLADLGDLHDSLDALGCCISCTIDAGDEDSAVLLDVDGGSRLLLDATDDLAAGADDIADLVGRNVEADDLRSRRLRVLARCRDGIEHRIEDEHAALVCLHECSAQDLRRESRSLVVHLHGRDALGRARDLEVHVAEEVLEALDVGQDDGLAFLLDEAHGNAGDRTLDGDACIHEGKGGTARRCHRRGAIGLHDLGDDADRVRELLLGGDHRQKGALGKVAVADLAALRAAHAARLARAERREVVVVDVALALDRLDRVKALPLVEHAKRADREDLGLSTLEEAGAMDARQIVRLHHERPYLGGLAAIDTLAGLDDHAAHCMLLEALELDRNGTAPGLLLLVGELCRNLGLEVLDLVDAGELVRILEGCAHLVVVREDAVVHLRDGLVEDVVMLRERAVGLLDLLEEDLLLLAEGSDGLLAECHGCEHVVLGDLLGASLEHGDERGGTAELEVEVARLALLVRRIHEPLARLGVAADPHAGKRTLKRHAADGEGSRCCHDADGVDRVDLVCDERRRDDLDLVPEPIREGRAQRTVDHAGCEGCLLARTRLALEVAARDATHGVHLLNEIDRQREEVVVLALLGDDRRQKDGGIPSLHEAGTGSLLRELACLERVVLAVQVEFMGYFHFSPYLRLPHCRRAVLHASLHAASPLLGDAYERRGRLDGALFQ